MARNADRRLHALAEMKTFGGPSQALLAALADPSQTLRAALAARPAETRTAQTAQLLRGTAFDPQQHPSAAGKRRAAVERERREQRAELATRIEGAGFRRPRAPDALFDPIGLPKKKAAQANAEAAQRAGISLSNKATREELERRGYPIPRQERPRGGRRAREAKVPHPPGLVNPNSQPTPPPPAEEGTTRRKRKPRMP